MMPRRRPIRRLRNGLPLVLLLLLTGFAPGRGGRYQDQGNGTVQDTQSGLLWLAHANCWGPMPWEEAQAAAARLRNGMCGLKDGSKPGDWRLPTQREWRSLVECQCGGIALNDDRGTGCYAAGASTFNSVQPKEYWSSTELSRGGEKARVVMSLHDGFDRRTAAEEPYFVWPVRPASATETQDDGG